MIQELPLNKANRIKLAIAFKNVPRVDLSIDSAIEGQMGKAFVDDLREHTTIVSRIHSKARSGFQF